jgi:predicted RNase H-like HicB family nuclease
MDPYQVQAVVYREDAHYVAQCLNVDGSSFGDTEEEALANLQEALELYFEDMPESVITSVETPEVRRLTVQSGLDEAALTR